MGLFPNKKIKAFGLDISDTSVKVMELVGDKGNFKPTAFADVLLPDKVISNNMIINQQKLADTIMMALSAAGHVESKFAICSIPEAKSFVRNLQLPKMEESEIDGAIYYELEQDIPIPVNQVYLDWQIIRQGPDKLDLLVTASPKIYVDALSSSLRLAKITPIAMELESQATARALIGPADLTKNVLIVDLATKQTSFIIVKLGVIQYTSSMPLAGKALTESIARNFNIPIDAAEKLKQAAGLIAEVDGANLLPAIAPILDRIIDEIKNIMRFFNEHDQNHKSIDTIILCGGTVKLAGLVEYVSHHINSAGTSVSSAGATVNKDNPLMNIIKNSIGLAPLDALGFTTVAGLALRGVTHEAD